MLSGGYSEPKYHAVSHARLAEGEATHRAIVLAELIDTPLLIVHVSSIEAIGHIVAARKKGLKILGETCPQYLFLTAEDLKQDGFEGAKCVCSPPPRDTPNRVPSTARHPTGQDRKRAAWLQELSYDTLARR